MEDTEQSTSAAARSTISSMNWNLADGNTEVVRTSDGMVHDKDMSGADITTPSRLCKKNMAELMITVSWGKIKIIFLMF